MDNTIVLELDVEEAFELLEFIAESDYPKTLAVLKVEEELNYALDDVEPIDFDSE